MRSSLKKTLTLICLSTPLSASISFTVSFTPDADTQLTAAEKALFTDGLDFWDDVIDGYQDGVSRVWNLNVDVFSTPSSGGGVTLGSAGPSGGIVSDVVPGSGLSAPWPNRFILSSGGNANFNIHPDAGPLQGVVIRHEIGHALGIGTLWEANEVYNDGDPNTSTQRTLAGGTPGQYTGCLLYTSPSPRD